VAGDDFIKSKRGLRQGCPLSPYLFILSTEVLSRSVLAAQKRGCLSRVKLTAGVPALTHIMYADNLVLLDQAEEGELTSLKEIMKIFGGVSGLRINNEKFVLWFSKYTKERERRLVQLHFPAKDSDDNTTYLGYHMPKGRKTSKHYNKLEVQMLGRLGGWKLHTLLHAGRLALTKHVLLVLPCLSIIWGRTRCLR
jgi:Reverse transcriptase (RNA-dependent DNA polymerase)